MSEEKKRQLHERMAALHEKYCNQLPNKYNEIAESWVDYQAELNNAEYRELFYRLIHTLKGTAGTFGYTAQSDICLKIQKLLLDANDALPESSVPLIQKHLTELKSIINTPAENIPD